MKGRLIATGLICLILTLTLDTTPTYGQQRPELKEWFKQVKQISEKYGVDANVALAVAEAESSGKGQRFRFGRLSKNYWGPFGIHRCFLKRWPIDDPLVNTEVGIRALARHRDLRKSLKKYNPQMTEAYYRRVISLARKNRVDGVFD